MATTGGGEVLGTARIDVALDTTELELGIRRANERMSEMASGAQDAYTKMNKGERQRIDTLKRQADMLGMTRQEQLAYNVTMKTSGKVQEDLLRTLARNTAELERSGRAAGKAGIEFNKYGISAKQTAAAMRQVPAQMTDIFVSLQGGQAPLTVLLQQGGQLKDIFGGVVPAARALGGALLGLINPYTILAAAIGGVAVAAFQGESETNGYRRALALTGDIANTTSNQLQAMAVQISDVNTTQAAAAAALTAVAASGKFLGNQFEIVAEAAVNMERATGQSLDTTIGKFAALADDPVNAVAKLNEETHFLTEAVFQQIKALQQQGDEQGAATLAMEAYADTVNARTGVVEESLGTLQTAWRAVLNVAKGAWDAMLDIGRGNTAEEEINKVALRVYNLKDAIKNKPNSAGGLANWKEQLATETAKLKTLMAADGAERRRLNVAAAKQEANDYAISQDRSIASHKSADEKRAAEITRSRGESNLKAARAMTAGDAALAQTIRDNQIKYEAALNAQGAKKKKKGVSTERADLRADLQAFKDQLAERQAAIQADTAILAAEYAAKLVSQEEYFSQTRVLLQRQAAAEDEALTGQLAVLKSRNVTGRDAIDVARQLGQVEAALVKSREKASGQLKVLSIQEQAYLKARENSYKDYVESLDLGTEAMRDQVRAQIASIGMGQRQFELQSRINQVLEEAADRERDLAKARRDGAMSPEEYERRSAANARAARERVRVEQDAYKQIEAAQQDWRAGMQAGLDDWITTASDVAGQVRDVTVGALDRIAGAFTEAALTGKFAWKSMLADILTEITKFLMKQAVLELVKMLTSWWANRAGGGQAVGTTGSGASMAGYAAQGWVGNSPTLAAYSNSIVSQPTPFYFAKGASFGIMGEAGSEAIMPLAKGPDGTLGVRVHGGAGGSGPVSVMIQTNIENGGASTSSTTQGEDAEMYRKFAERMRTVAQNEITQAMRPNGALWKAGVTA